MNTLYIKLLDFESIDRRKKEGSVLVFPREEIHGPFLYVQFFADTGVVVGMARTEDGTDVKATFSARLKDGSWAVGKDGKGQKWWRSLLVDPNP
jgi:hypothetical protein